MLFYVRRVPRRGSWRIVFQGDSSAQKKPIVIAGPVAINYDVGYVMFVYNRINVHAVIFRHLARPFA